MVFNARSTPCDFVSGLTRFHQPVAGTHGLSKRGARIALAHVKNKNTFALMGRPPHCAVDPRPGRYSGPLRLVNVCQRTVNESARTAVRQLIRTCLPCALVGYPPWVVQTPVAIVRLFFKSRKRCPTAVNNRARLAAAETIAAQEPL